MPASSEVVNRVASDFGITNADLISEVQATYNMLGPNIKPGHDVKVVRVLFSILKDEAEQEEPRLNKIATALRLVTLGKALFEIAQIVNIDLEALETPLKFFRMVFDLFDG